MKKLPQAYTSFAELIEREYHLTFSGVIDAPQEADVDLPLVACRADPVNPLLCVIAKNADMHPEMFGPRFLKAYVEPNKAFTAHVDAAGGSFHLVRWKHNGSWLVNAFDSKDPERIRRMRLRVDRGASVNFEAPPPKVSHKTKPRDPNAPPVQRRAPRKTLTLPTRRERMADIVSMPAANQWE